MRKPNIKIFIEDGCPYCRAVYENIVIGYLDRILRLKTIVINISHNYGYEAEWWRRYSMSLLGRVGTPAIVFFDDRRPYDDLLEPVNICILSKRGGKIIIKRFKDELLALRNAIEEFIKNEYSEYYNYIMYINNKQKQMVVSLYGI